MALVEFNRQLLELDEGANLLNALERWGLPLRRGCGAGVCQGCLVQILEGTITPRAQEGLSPHQKAQGLAMACMCQVVGRLRAQTPSEPSARFASQVLRQRWLKGDILQLCLSKPFDYQPGQYVRMYATAETTAELHSVGRCYSLASLPQEPHVEFHIRVLPGGHMSQYLAQLPLGSPLFLQGPLGRCFYQARNPMQPLLLAAIGTGMAPILGIARAAVKAGHKGPIYCVMGARQEAGLYPLPGLHQVAAAPNVLISYVVQQAGLHSDTYEIGDIYSKIRTLLPDMTGAQAYICGAPSFVHTLKQQCFLAGARLQDIFADAFLPT